MQPPRPGTIDGPYMGGRMLGVGLFFIVLVLVPVVILLALVTLVLVEQD